MYLYFYKRSKSKTHLPPGRIPLLALILNLPLDLLDLVVGVLGEFCGGKEADGG